MRPIVGLAQIQKQWFPIVKRLFNESNNKMQHYYQLNKNIERYRIAKIKNRKSTDQTCYKSCSMNLIKINSFKDVKNQFPLNKKFKNLPYKEDWYLEKRYFNHPIYKYNVWGLKKIIRWLRY